MGDLMIIINIWVMINKYFLWVWCVMVFMLNIFIKINFKKNFKGFIDFISKFLFLNVWCKFVFKGNRVNWGGIFELKKNFKI